MSRVLFSGALALALAWCIASLWFPFGWDQGIMAAVGDAIVDGGMPYRDGWDMKGPLTFYVFAVAQWTFGRNMWGIRVIDVALLLGAAYALAKIVSAVTEPFAGRWTAVALVLWVASVSWFFVSQPDGWAAMLMTFAVATLLTPSTTPRALRFATCGLLIGCCTIIKPFYAAFILVPVVYAVTPAGHRLQKRIAWVLAAGGAAALPAVIVAAWFVYRGALSSLIEVHFSYARAYSGLLGPEVLARAVYNYFWSNGQPTPAGAVAVILPAVAAAVLVQIKGRRDVGWTLFSWLAVALFCVTIQGKFWVYHWIPTFPPFLALGAIGLWNIGRSSGHSGVGRILAVSAAALFFWHIATPPLVDVARWAQMITGIKSRDDYHGQQFRRFYIARDVIEASNYIRDHTTETDTVAVWGNEATINYLSGRRNPTRFVFAMPITAEAGPLSANYRQEYLQRLRAAPPSYFVVGQPHNGSPDKAAALRAFPELQQFVSHHYRLDREIGFLELYRRL